MNKKKLNKPLQILLIIALVTALLAPVFLAPSAAQARISDALSQIASESPNEIVRVVVQQTDDSDQARKAVESLGGEWLKDLDFINAFVARIQAKSLPRLAQNQSVSQIFLDAPVRSTSLITEIVRDEFNNKSFSNNDGTASWLGGWQEINESDGPTSGDERIVDDMGSNRLRVRDNDGGGEGVYRQADLSQATNATLSFDFRRVGLDKSSDYITLDISTDGSNWMELDRFAGPGTDDDYQTRNYDISGYLSSQTTIRFLTSSGNGRKDIVYFDNLQIEYEYDDGAVPVEDPPAEDPPVDPIVGDGGDPSGIYGLVYTVRDEFSTGDFTGQDGLDLWAIDWIEDDPANTEPDPSGGYVQMVDGELRLNNQNYDDTQPGVTRAVPLSWVTSAQLSFDYRTGSGVDIADGIAVEVSPDGGANWVLLDTIENLAGVNSGAVSYDITPFATPDTLVRVRVAYFYAHENEYFYVDNLEVAYTFDGEVPQRANLASVADNFNSYPYTYGASTGSEPWLTDWTETGDDGLPLSGDVHYTGIEGHRAFTIWTDAGETWQSVRGIQRSADLTGADWAEISFYYMRGSMQVGDFLYVEVSTDGGVTWTEVGHVEGKGTQAIAGSDQGWRYAGFDISNFISANTAIRLVTDFAPGDYYDNIYLEDVKILFDRPTGSPPPNYYLDTLNVRPVWEMGYDGSGVTVAVVDSGVALDHDFSSLPEDLNADRVLLQLGFNQNSTIIHDAFGHGTHVAGIIAGNGSGSNGFYQGVAPGANLIGLKVSDDLGMAYESDTVAALQWIFDHKDEYNIRVVNLSIASTVEQYYYDSALNLAVEILWLNGVVVVASAGNEWDGEYINSVRAAPANDPFIITVGASDESGTADRSDDTITPFTARGFSLSNYYKPEIIAPGKDIVSTLAGSSEWRNDHSDRFVEGGYFRISGTSMSAPMVAGAAALLLQAEPDLTPDQVKYRLVTTGGLVEYHPYLDVHAALTTPTTENLNWQVKPHTVLAQMALIAYWASENGDENVDWENVDWAAVNWNAVNWNAVNWNAVNWNAVNWNAVNWNAVNWNAVNWNAVNWNAVNWNAVNWNAVNWNSVHWEE